MSEATSGPVNTKRAERREIELRSMNELRAELDRLEAAHHAGTLRWTGNWTPGQVFRHLAIFMRFAIDGFPATMRPPAPLKWMALLAFKKKAVTGQPPPPGFRFFKGAEGLDPGPDVSFEDGLAELREVVGRLDGGDRFTHPSPLCGPRPAVDRARVGPAPLQVAEACRPGRAGPCRPRA
jgi:hypothetical protein